jgi:hypothetical protein
MTTSRKTNKTDAAKPAALGAVDLERHEELLDLAGEAQALRERVRDIEGALRIGGERLCSRYDVDADAGEAIELDGTIRRADAG